MDSEPETAIFRRFGDLTISNLLRLQAELHDLEHQLEEVRDEDARSNDPVRTKYASDFRLMRDWAEDGDSLQHDLLDSIGTKLQEYHAALTQALEVSKARSPTKREVDFLRSWLIRPSLGANFQNHPEDTIWSKSNDGDFITLRSQESENDPFTSVLNGFLLDIYHRIWGQQRKHNQSEKLGRNIRRYNDEHILRVSKVIGATLSSLLPTLVILVLFFVKRMLVRIGLVIVFTAVFSLTLSLLTEARKVEIFSATAAFAAVEVVFVGSTSINGTA
ncbi:uncharacterized protein K441DRAFT_627195 [Cenococcum geophilum 1.58]|uniref:uncharacterized protein n=1 Tax=Cenococcum geophilum 1.58 TaxID=794803 RepID=UPI00358E5161|nr:hypothetical protein K441DRAFT_627195 [Cenococcum geophilum 1.58]